MRRLFLSFAVMALSLIGVGVAPQPSVAAPLVGPNYTASAGGALATIDLDRASGPDLAGVTLAVSDSKLNGGSPPTTSALASNLGAGVTGAGIALQTDVQNAPPDNPSPSTDSFAAASGPDLDLGLLDTSVHARAVPNIACSPSGGVVATSQVQTAGAILDPVPFGTIADTGDSSTTATVSILPEPAGDPLNRALLSTATGNISTSTFLNGQVGVAIAGQSQLQAFASGVPGGANTTYSPGTVSVTVGGTTYPVAAGGEFDTDVDLPSPLPNGRVVITANEPNVTESVNGQNATATVAVVTAVVTVGTGPNPPATATVDILPLRASAVAPPGGLDCLPPAPVLNTPANGSTTADVTPTFTGTAVRGAEVKIFVDGNPNPIGTTTANPSGNFSFTPTTPLAGGDHIARARQTTDGGTSQQSNANDFTIVGPPVLDDPADGTVTNDTTPTFAGTALPGAQVDILVDGNPNPIGTTTANPSGNFSFTPGTPLAPGDYEASARARLNGVTSGPSNINGFAIDTDAPAAPVITSPEDGSTTTDPSFPIRGTAEPGSRVIIIKDGEEIGSTMADENGDFTFNLPSGLLPVGRYGFSARAVDAAGNSSQAAEPVYVEVLGAALEAADDGPGQPSLADTGGPQGWVSLAAALGVLAGAGILAVTRWRRRGSQTGH